MSTAIAPVRLIGHDAAYYAALGWQVIPLHDLARGGRCSCGRDCGNSAGKHPRLNEWQKHATDDVEQVKAWWRDWPHANIGVRLGSGSGFVGIDIDPPGGEQALLDISHGDLPPTLEMRTGKGRRLLYGIPESLTMEPATVGFKDDNGEESIRLQGGRTGAQCVMPPSMHYLGHRYEWVHGPETRGLAPMPDWLILEMCKPAQRDVGWGEAGERKPIDGTEPWTAFNKRDSWTEWLTKWGYRFAGGTGDTRYFTRPGKTGGVSVSLGHYQCNDGTPALYVFSGNCPNLDAGKCYDLFGAFARHEFGGNFSAAAKMLLERGYGEKRASYEDRIKSLERRVAELEARLNAPTDPRRTA